MADSPDFVADAPGSPECFDRQWMPSIPVEDEQQFPGAQDRAGPKRRLTLSDVLFYGGCFGLSLLPATLAGVLLYDFIGEPVLFLVAIVTSTWVVTVVALVKMAGPTRGCRAIVAGGGLVSVALCSLFLLE